ncbi:alpha-L-fucosidase [Muricomes intestini]|uniref:alpha-L-fucosidase n=1 Tax=Muricomes intestini TaxID=1796634 RepID=UPI002FDC7E16
MVAKLLIDTVSKGGNMLLNIGPNGRGEWDAKTGEIIEKMGEWMRLHGTSIYGCGSSEFEAPADARFTQKGNHLYLHLFSWPYRTLLIDKLGGRVSYARLLNDSSEIKYIQGEGLMGIRKSHKNLNDEVTEIHIKDKFDDNALLVTLPVQRPDVLVPVIEFILKD